MAENRDYLEDISYIIAEAIRKEGLKGAIRLLETLDRGSMEVYDQYKNQYKQNDTGVIPEKFVEPYKQNDNDEISEKYTEPSRMVEVPLDTTSFNEASIYRESAKPLVEQDRQEHSAAGVSSISNESADNNVSEELLKNEGPVLKKTINNPWSGIETVSPGQLKL